MRSDLVYCGERVDDLQNGLFVIQDPKKFCFGMDAVLLSGFARVKKGEVALDMGTGTGIIPILLSDRTDGEHFTGLEIQHECAEMADRSVRYNGLEDRVRIVEGDIKEAAGIFGAASFDVVTTPQGTTGTVQSVNVLRQMVKIVVDVNDEKEIQEFPVRDLKFRPKKKKGKGGVDHEEKEGKKGDSKPNEK